MKKLFFSKKGFTFVEVMISLLIFAITFSGLLSTYIMRRQTIDIANNHKESVRIAQKQVETLKNIGYAGVKTLPPNPPAPQVLTEAVIIGIKGSGLPGVMITTIIDQTDYLEIIVSIGWLQRSFKGSNLHTESITTIISP